MQGQADRAADRQNHVNENITSHAPPRSNTRFQILAQSPRTCSPDQCGRPFRTPLVVVYAVAVDFSNSLPKVRIEVRVAQAWRTFILTNVNSVDSGFCWQPRLESQRRFAAAGGRRALSRPRF